MLVQRPVLAVPVCPGGIEDHAVGMQLGVVVPAGAMLKHRGRDIGRQHFDLAVPVTDTGIGAMPQHRFLQRYASRIVMRPVDLRTQLGIGDGPQGRDALVRAEGHVETRRTALAAGIAREFATAVRSEAVIQPVEVAAVDLAAVDKTKQAVGVEPHSVRLFSRRVILVGMAERALALQVVRGRRRLGECRYHDELRKAGGMTAATEPSAAFRPGVGTASMTTGAEILISVRSLPGFPKQIIPR